MLLWSKAHGVLSLAIQEVFILWIEIAVTLLGRKLLPLWLVHMANKKILVDVKVSSSTYLEDFALDISNVIGIMCW
jgi:hypothetical protein